MVSGCMKRALSRLWSCVVRLWESQISPDVHVKDVALFPHQAAGHGTILRRHDADAILLKPVMKGEKGQVEKRFYASLARDQSGIRQFVPVFHGFVRVLSPSAEPTEYIQMEDLTRPFKCPCILDLKMGRVTYDPHADASKRMREAGKYAWQRDLGFRITGMRVYRHDTQKHKIFGKSYGRELPGPQILNGFRDYLDTGLDLPLHPLLLPSLLTRLRAILQWMEAQRSFRLFASSLLVIYEAAADKGQTYRTGSRVTVHMIDFGHVFPYAHGPLPERPGEDPAAPPPQQDDGYLYGLRNVIAYIQQLYQQQQQQQQGQGQDCALAITPSPPCSPRNSLATAHAA